VKLNKIFRGAQHVNTAITILPLLVLPSVPVVRILRVINAAFVTVNMALVLVKRALPVLLVKDVPPIIIRRVMANADIVWPRRRARAMVCVVAMGCVSVTKGTPDLRATNVLPTISTIPPANIVWPRRLVMATVYVLVSAIVLVLLVSRAPRAIRVPPIISPTPSVDTVWPRSRAMAMVPVRVRAIVLVPRVMPGLLVTHVLPITTAIPTVDIAWLRRHATTTASVPRAQALVCVMWVLSALHVLRALPTITIIPTVDCVWRQILATGMDRVLLLATVLATLVSRARVVTSVPSIIMAILLVAIAWLKPHAVEKGRVMRRVYVAVMPSSGVITVKDVLSIISTSRLVVPLIATRVSRAPIMVYVMHKASVCAIPLTRDSFAMNAPPTITAILAVLTAKPTSHARVPIGAVVRTKDGVTVLLRMRGTIVNSVALIAITTPLARIVWLWIPVTDRENAISSVTVCVTRVSQVLNASNAKRVTTVYRVCLVLRIRVRVRVRVGVRFPAIAMTFLWLVMDTARAVMASWALVFVPATRVSMA